MKFVIALDRAWCFTLSFFSIVFFYRGLSIAGQDRLADIEIIKANRSQSISKSNGCNHLKRQSKVFLSVLGQSAKPIVCLNPLQWFIEVSLTWSYLEGR